LPKTSYWGSSISPSTSGSFLPIDKWDTCDETVSSDFKSSPQHSHSLKNAFGGEVSRSEESKLEVNDQEALGIPVPSLQERFSRFNTSANSLIPLKKMGGEKTSGGGWRSRFGKKSHNADEGSIAGDPLVDMMNIDKKSSTDNLRTTGRSRDGKASAMMGFDDEREMAAQQIARQQRAANVLGILYEAGSRTTPKPPATRLDDYRTSNRGALEGGMATQGRSKLERMMGDQGPATAEYSGSQTHHNNGMDSSYQPSLNNHSHSNTAVSSDNIHNNNNNNNNSSKSHLDIDETSCPVCLELLSFRLAGEKPHVTPVCGHALHHACFTAVYGPPEAILAAQNASGRAPPPGMCGVCRKLIVLGDESENRRQNSESSFAFLLANL